MACYYRNGGRLVYRCRHREHRNSEIAAHGRRRYTPRERDQRLRLIGALNNGSEKSWNRLRVNR